MSSTADVELVKEGPLTIIVCAPSDLTEDAVQRGANLASLCGTTTGWQLASPDNTRDEDEWIKCRPVQCQEAPGERTHYMLFA